MTNIIKKDDLLNFCTEACKKFGLSDETSRITAEVLTETDMMGTYSHGTKNLLDYMRKIQAGGIKVNGEIIAMSFGEKLNDDTALIQVELADENYRGSYQAINRFFCENEWKDFKYINREEDMGIEGLRRAKESYQPEFMVEKFYIEERI